MPADYHTHTPLCRHAEGEPEAFVDAALAAGLTRIRHLRPRAAGARAVRRLADAGARNCRIISAGSSARAPMPRAGSRSAPGWSATGWRAANRGSPTSPSRHEWDYLIGSVHYLGDWDFDNPKWLGRWAESDVDAVWTHYWQTYAKMAESGLFDILGHPDLVKKFAHRPGRRSGSRFTNRSIDAIAASGCVIELNTAGWHKPCAEAYPAPRFLELACSAGIAAGDFLGRARAGGGGAGISPGHRLAKAAGYRETELFEKRRRRSESLG